MMSTSDIIAISNAASAAAGIPQLLLLACGVAESNLNPAARRPADPSQDATYWPDVSFGLYQQTVRWATEYHGGATYPGEDEIARVGALYLDPQHAATVAAANLKGKYFPDEPDAIFAALCRYNYPGGHGQPASAEVAANYRRGIAEAQTLLGGAPVPDPLTYNLALPIVPQNHDWDCAEQSALWAVTAAGRHPSDAWLEQAMLASGIESTALGLLVGDGSALAAWITSEYSDPGEGTPTLTAHNAASVSFDDVRSVAGSVPVMLGGHRWGSAGHWTGIRGYDATADALLLANPADGYAGIGQTMSRQQFDQVAPCAMVVVIAAGAQPAPAPAPPADPKDAQIAALQEKVNGLTVALAQVCDVLAGDRLQAVQDQAAAIREQFIGKRPAA